MTQADQSIEAVLQAMTRARQAGNVAGERQLLADAVMAHPDDPRIHNARGMRALADRDTVIAITSFTRAAELDATEPALRMNLATAYRAAGDTDGEQASLQAALDLDQLNFMAHVRMAELMQRKGEMATAAYHWSGVVQMAAGMDAPPPGVREAAARGQKFLADHGAAYANALDAEIGALPHDASTRRFRACVDHMLGKRQVYRNECAGLYYPFLPADEFFDRELFPWFAEIEARTPAIRAEALALMRDGEDAIRPYVRQAKGTPDNKWSALDHSLEWSACFLWEYGEPNEAVCARCPETAAALRLAPQNHVPGKAPSAFFSILRPGARIPPHTGVTNTRAIIHLPLVVPPGCGFRVGGETRPWREGEAFAFDDTIEHEAWNNSGDPRIVLIFDVWNPHLSVAEQEHLAKLFAVADRDTVSTKAG